VKIEEIEVERLSPHPRNSRTHTREQITAIGRALKEWGWQQPVVADENLVILIGHGRVEAAKAMGLKTAPVLIRKGLSDEKKRALLISDNRLAELGSSWDDGVLADELRYLLDNDFDVTLTAFDLPELPPDGLEPKPAPEPETIVTMPGDVWLLGKHRLACGNPGAQAQVLDAAPALLVTKASQGDAEALGAALAATEAPVAYVWHIHAIGPLVARLLEATGFEIRCQIIRDREASGGRGYGIGHDPCWYAVRKGAKARYYGGRTQSTLWRIPSPSRSLPVECWKRPIQNHTNHHEVVLDPLAGSGSVFVAAQQTARLAAGVEIDPAACDLAVRRWEYFTGREARHGATGKTYGETAGERATEGQGPSATPATAGA
jgi:ParB-like chromosome segregation protein Spo0J